MNEMSERVVRASKSHWVKGDGGSGKRWFVYLTETGETVGSVFETAADALRECERRNARAAIEALRKLPPALLEHIQNGEIEVHYENVPIGICMNHSYDAAGYWNAFIDEMLK